MTSVENIPVRAAGGGRSVESMGRQAQTPYADALRGYAAQDWLRLNVPGHTASAKAAPELVATLGDGVLELDIPPLVDGIDKGAWPTPLDRAEGLAAEAWGARCAQRALDAEDARRANHAMAREVGLPLMRGLLALVRGDADSAASSVRSASADSWSDSISIVRRPSRSSISRRKVSP